MIKSLKPWLIIITFALLLMMVGSCYNSNSEIGRREIANVADQKDRDIIIALVDTSDNPSLFLEGAKLAIEELNGEGNVTDTQTIHIYGEDGKIKKSLNLNQSGGVLSGRKIIPLVYDDKGKPKKGLQIAKNISNNLDVVAVIGHRFSKVAIPVSLIYEKNGVVFISIGSTHPLLTAHENVYIFRNIPSDRQIGKILAQFAKREKFQKIMVFFERGLYGKRLAEFFKEEAENQEIEIVATRSYFALAHDKEERDFRPLFVEIKDKKFDAIFLAGYVSQAATFIKQARSMGIFVPFIGGDSLDNPELWEKVELDGIGTFVASFFDPNLSENSQKFVERFQEKYGKFPDSKAAQGYDAVKVLAWAIENCRSTIPLEIAMALKYMEKWENVVGPYTFTFKGDVTQRQIHIKVLSPGGEFKKITSLPDN